MASNYTCRACTKAILRPSNVPTYPKLIPRTWSLCTASRAHRSFATKPAAKDRITEIPIPVKVAEKPKRPVSAGSIARKIREKAPAFAETYVSYGATEKLLNECTKQGEYNIPQALEKNGQIPTDENGVHLGIGHGWWYETLGLTPNFINWAQITFIHMYMLQVRLRMFPSENATLWVQHFTNHAFYAAEDRLAVLHKMTAASLRQKHLKDMFSNWRAVLLSYDEGLVKGDAVLAAAVWRNLLAGKEDVDFQKLAQIVGYMRREIKRLDEATDQEVAMGDWTFRGDPGSEADAVRRPSRAMEEKA